MLSVTDLVVKSSWTKFWIVLLVVFILLLYLLTHDVISTFRNSGIGLMLFGMLVLASSAFAGNTQAVPDALVVDGIGTMDDIHVAKRRANNILGPFIGVILGLIIYLFQWILSIIL
jgi:hypothetical protein